MTATALSVCPRCGTGLRENAKFCDECGSPLTGPETHAEFKQVTVLFADVVGSMGIAAGPPVITPQSWTKQYIRYEYFPLCIAR